MICDELTGGDGARLVSGRAGKTNEEAMNFNERHERPVFGVAQIRGLDLDLSPNCSGLANLGQASADGGGGGAVLCERLGAG